MTQETLTAEQEAAQIHERLSGIAPWEPDGAVTALGLARHQAVAAQVTWARMLGMDHPITPQDVAIVQGRFGTAHALLALYAVNPARADQVAAEIRDAFEDGGGIGEWLWEHLGGRAQEIATLADRLAELTAPAVKDAATATGQK